METTMQTPETTAEIARAVAALLVAPAFTVRRIGPEAAALFRALPEYQATGCRFVMFGEAQIRIETKLNGVAVLARIN